MRLVPPVTWDGDGCLLPATQPVHMRTPVLTVEQGDEEPWVSSYPGYSGNWASMTWIIQLHRSGYRSENNKMFLPNKKRFLRKGEQLLPIVYSLGAEGRLRV